MIRTKLFLDTWKLFLRKQGYTEAHHFISKEAYDICSTLVNSLLGIIIIYRDHTSHPVPLLIWKLQSEGNEQGFSCMRKLSPDFSVQEAIFAMPKLCAMALSSSKARFGRDNFKATASGYQHTYLHDTGLDYSVLSTFPSDAEFTEAYHLAIEENDTLWTLLGVYPELIKSVPEPSIVPLAVDLSNDLPHNEEDLPQDDELSTHEELQHAIDRIEKTYDLT